MSRPASTPTLADEWDAIHTILAPLLSEPTAAERRATLLAKYGQPRFGATLGEIDQVIDALLVRMRTEPKSARREESRSNLPRVPTQPPADMGAKRAAPPPPLPVAQAPNKPAAVPPPIPAFKAPDKGDKHIEPQDELDGMPPLPPAVPAGEGPPKTRRGKPAIGYDESGALVPMRSGTAPETYFLYDDIVTLSGLNDWDGVLISLERLLVLAKLEDHIKEFVDANEVKLLSIYETFLKSFGRVPKRLPAAVDNSMPRPFLRAEKIAGVLAMIDGKVTIQEILKRSTLTPLETCSALCQLRRAGVVDVP